MIKTQLEALPRPFSFDSEAFQPSPRPLSHDEYIYVDILHLMVFVSGMQAMRS